MVMVLRRKGFRRQKTKTREKDWMKRESGQVNWVVGLFLLLFIAVLLMTTIQSQRFRATALYTEDALAASNLASALVNLEEYGISHRVLIAEPWEAYECYQRTLKENLNLNEEWQGAGESVVSGVVTVENYIVYNVDGEKVLIYRFGAEGESVWEERLGSVTAPNGIPIQNTSVYSEISFLVDVVPGISMRACMGKLVDIVRNNG